MSATFSLMSRDLINQKSMIDNKKVSKKVVPLCLLLDLEVFALWFMYFYDCL